MSQKILVDRLRTEFIRLANLAIEKGYSLDRDVSMELSKLANHNMHIGPVESKKLAEIEVLIKKY